MCSSGIWNVLAKPGYTFTLKSLSHALTKYILHTSNFGIGRKPLFEIVVLQSSLASRGQGGTSSIEFSTLSQISAGWKKLFLHILFLGKQRGWPLPCSKVE